MYIYRLNFKPNIMKTEITLGIDIGGTNTAFGLIDKKGKCVGEGNIPTWKHSNIQDYLNEIHETVEKLYAPLKENFSLAGIGIGAPSGNYYDGTIEATNLPWKGRIRFCELFQKFYPEIPVCLTNDANAAAIGEMVYGNAKGMKNFIMVTLGTGVGSGFVANGEMIYGHDGFAGELGHIIVSPGGRECGCGRKGCLETYVSATGVKRTVYKMLAEHNIPSELRDVPFNKLESKKVAEAAEKGDKIAQFTFEYTGRKLGEALANATAITSPEAIFLMGGLAKAGSLIFEPTKKHMEGNMLYMYKNKVKLLPSGIKGNVAIYGASALAWNEIEKNKKI